VQRYGAKGMVDLFALGVTHLLMALACWRLALRDDLDRDPPAKSGGGEDQARA
jgi:hypothetical protein